MSEKRDNKPVQTLITKANELLAVCETEFGYGDGSPADASVMASSDDDSPITFGHLRRLRKALNGAVQWMDKQPASQQPKVEGRAEGGAA